MKPEESFTNDQIRILMLMERIGGSVSLLTVTLIFIAYGVIPRTRNVQNTFIVFASISNVGASIASIIAFDGLQAGKSTALCQAQSFLFEMFMQSDPWWSLAMAINVLFVFYFHATPESFQRWWWVYCIICYGGPFLIALALLFVKNTERGSVYGEATIWCWVDRRWDDIRIYTYYMLIWICIIGSGICYALVGYYVFRSRNRLRGLSGSKARDCQIENTQTNNNEAHYGTVVTEVRIMHSAVPQSGQEQGGTASFPLPQPEKNGSLNNLKSEEFKSAGLNVQHDSTLSQCVSSTTSPSPCGEHRTPSLLSRAASASRSVATKFVIDDPVKRAYLRTSFLFAISVLVTWIPSSLNRIHSWVHGQSPFEFHVATAAVLPLQGVWNAVIFFVTSWSTVRKGSFTQRTAANADARVRERPGSGPPLRRQGGVQHRDYCSRTDSDLEDGDSGTVGSEIELRRVGKYHTERSFLR